MRRFKIVVALAVSAVLAADFGSAIAADQAKPSPAPGGATSSQPRQLIVPSQAWTGDFDQMLERRLIRALVPISRTLYYADKGRERGMTAELMRSWERALNKKYAKQLEKRAVTLLIIPTTRDKLISGLVEGRGDIAAGNITVTDQRLSMVDFVAPSDLATVNEIVVTGPKAPPINSVEDLAGKTVHVRKSASYHDSLVALNERFAKEGKPKVTLVLLPDALEDEDTLEMVNAGVVNVVIVDDWIANIWAQVLPNIKVIKQAAVRTGGHAGWAIRKDSPKLRDAIMDFYTSTAQKQGLVGYLKTQGRKQIKNNTADEDVKRFDDMLALFHKYGTQYNFDPLMLAAQGYQESQLNQNAKSHVGAIGVMQLMPATGQELKVGDIRAMEPNIHAGAKYLDQLMTKNFPDAKFSEQNRALFAFASYNAGPGNISRMRKLATTRGLNPDEWFNNIEIVTAEKIGIETTTYVRNIYKYYVAYKLLLEQKEQRERLKEQLKKGG